MAGREYAVAGAEREEEVRCTLCGTLNVVTYRYSDFGPANQERETGKCATCRAQVASAKCLGISTRLAETKPDVPRGRA